MLRLRGLRTVSLALLAGLFVAGVASAAPGSQKAVLLPVGTPITVVLRQTVATATAKPGDHIEAALARPLIVNQQVAALEGSKAEGRVVAVTASGRLSRPAVLDFTMTGLTPTGGQPVSITTSHYHRRGDTHTKRDINYIAGGAAVGALIGQLAGRNTESTLEGAAAGAAAGTGVAAATGQLDFEVEAGRTVTFKLRKAISLPVSRE